MVGAGPVGSRVCEPATQLERCTNWAYCSKGRPFGTGGVYVDLAGLGKESGRVGLPVRGGGPDALHPRAEADGAPRCAPPDASQQIAALEKDTGLVLFEREPHGVRMTAAAHRLVELSRRVLAGVDELENQVRQLATGASGRIRLGGFPTGNVGLVPRVLQRFMADRPGADVKLEEGEPDELVDALVGGDLDIAFLYEYGLCPRRWPDEVITQPLLCEDLMLLRRAGSGLPAELSRLGGQSWIPAPRARPGRPP